MFTVISYLKNLLIFFILILILSFLIKDFSGAGKPVMLPFGPAQEPSVNYVRPDNFLLPAPQNPQLTIQNNPPIDVIISTNPKKIAITSWSSSAVAILYSTITEKIKNGIKPRKRVVILVFHQTPKSNCHLPLLLSASHPHNGNILP